MGDTTSRRTFLKTTGVAAVGIGCGVPLLASLAKGSSPSMRSGKDAGPRWAMVVDRRKCPEDCTKCIDACHAEHNVPDIGTKKEEVKWAWREPFQHAFPNQEQEYMKEGLRDEKTLVFCNHCDNPPCVRVCPTQATWKRDDGVVMMDMHRCIGCRYCIVGCPYGSRSFNWRDPRPYIDDADLNEDFPTRTKGVVEKCNFCAERLGLPDEKDRVPACVQSCDHGALYWGNINDEKSKVRELLNTNYTIRRRSGLGTRPHVFYIVGGDDA